MRYLQGPVNNSWPIPACCQMLKIKFNFISQSHFYVSTWAFNFIDQLYKAQSLKDRYGFHKNHFNKTRTQLPKVPSSVPYFHQDLCPQSLCTFVPLLHSFRYGCLLAKSPFQKSQSCSSHFFYLPCWMPKTALYFLS